MSEKIQRKSDDEVIESFFDRIKVATTIAHRYGMIDGAHHKQWVIDQMVRALLDPADYEAWAKNENPEEYQDWDTGTPP